VTTENQYEHRSARWKQQFRGQGRKSAQRRIDMRREAGAEDDEDDEDDEGGDGVGYDDDKFRDMT
jgi:hypothetical protein